MHTFKLGNPCLLPDCFYRESNLRIGLEPKMCLAGTSLIIAIAVNASTPMALIHAAPRVEAFSKESISAPQDSVQREPRAVAELSDADRVTILSEVFRILDSEGVKKSFLDGGQTAYVVADGKSFELLKSMKDLDFKVVSGSEFTKIQNVRGPKGFIGIGFSSSKSRSITVTVTYNGGVRSATNAIEARRHMLEFEFSKKRKTWEMVDINGATP